VEADNRGGLWHTSPYACPIDCIHPMKETTYDDGRPTFEQVSQLYIDPIEYRDCGACVPVCPVSAIFALDDRQKICFRILVCIAVLVCVLMVRRRRSFFSNPVWRPKVFELENLMNLSETNNRVVWLG
jgi:NAD-dependent dihydropyrimidine dehydrogenase PreA subunit